MVRFEEYVRARGPALLRFARALTGDAHRAEDLVQDVLVRAYPRWARIVRSDRPDVYLRRAVVNAHISWWRRRRNRETPGASDMAVEDAVSASGAGDPSGPAVERDAVWRQVRRLPARQRAVVVLRYYEDLDDATISDILGCSVVTVRTQASRAIATLRKRWTPAEGSAPTMTSHHGSMS